MRNERRSTDATSRPSAGLNAGRYSTAGADTTWLDRRGASEVVSFALVFGLVVSAVAIISISGVESLQSARNAEQLNNAERAFDVLENNIADVYAGGAPSRATEINLAGAQLVAQSNVTVNVTLTKSGGGRTVIERPVRPIVYDGGRNQRIVYEAGAVFRTSNDGGVVLADPPLLINGQRSYFHLVAVQSDGRQSAGGTTVLVRTTERQRELVVGDTSDSFDDYFVNVTSPRRDRWGEILEERGFTQAARGTDASGDAFVTYRRPAPPNNFVLVVEIDLAIDQ